MRLSREALLLVVVFAVFCALYPLLLLRRQAEDPVKDYSTYRTNATGAKALFTVLQQFGLHVARSRRPATTIPPDAAVVCILSPRAPIEADEARTLAEWVRRGGTLILSCEEGERLILAGSLTLADVTAKLRAAFGLESAKPRGSAGVVPVNGSAPELRDVREVSVASSARLRGVGRMLVADDAGGIVAQVAVGDGTLIALSEPSLFCNAQLSSADNALLAANIFFHYGRGGTIYFDEYHHGFTEAVSLRELLVGSGLSRAFWPAAAALALALIAVGARLGVPVSARRRDRRSASEFVRAMACLYRDGGAAAAALRALSDSSRRRLAQSLGAGAAMPDERLAQLASRRRGDAREMLSLLRRASDAASGPSLSDEELLELAQGLTRLSERPGGHACTDGEACERRHAATAPRRRRPG